MNAELDRLLDEPEIRAAGRFDLVLLNDRRDRPAHILESKRGAKTETLMHDIRRLAKVCLHAGRKSLETNYLVFTRRATRDAGDITKLMERLDQALITDGLDSEVTIRARHSDPLHPFLNSAQIPIPNGAFQIVVVEVRAKERL